MEKLQKDGVISEDQLTSYKDSIQKATDASIKAVDDMEASKGKELMQV